MLQKAWLSGKLFSFFIFSLNRPGIWCPRTNQVKMAAHKSPVVPPSLNSCPSRDKSHSAGGQVKLTPTCLPGKFCSWCKILFTLLLVSEFPDRQAVLRWHLSISKRLKTWTLTFFFSKVAFYFHFWDFSWDILRLPRQLTSSAWAYVSAHYDTSGVRTRDTVW